MDKIINFLDRKDSLFKIDIDENGTVHFWYGSVVHVHASCGSEIEAARKLSGTGSH